MKTKGKHVEVWDIPSPLHMVFLWKKTYLTEIIVSVVHSVFTYISCLLIQFIDVGWCRWIFHGASDNAFPSFKQFFSTLQRRTTLCSPEVSLTYRMVAQGLYGSESARCQGFLLEKPFGELKNGQSKSLVRVVYCCWLRSWNVIECAMSSRSIFYMK